MDGSAPDPTQGETEERRGREERERETWKAGRDDTNIAQHSVPQSLLEGRKHDKGCMTGRGIEIPHSRKSSARLSSCSTYSRHSRAHCVAGGRYRNSATNVGTCSVLRSNRTTDTSICTDSAEFLKGIKYLTVLDASCSGRENSNTLPSAKQGVTINCPTYQFSGGSGPVTHMYARIHKKKLHDSVDNGHKHS